MERTMPAPVSMFFTRAGVAGDPVLNAVFAIATADLQFALIKEGLAKTHSGSLAIRVLQSARIIDVVVFSDHAPRR